MRGLIVLAALLAAGCGSSPTAPTPSVVTPPVTQPPVVQTISVAPCPSATPGVDLGFYLEIGCNSFDQPIQPVRRWTVAPKIYLKTVDEAGAQIDAVTLDTVQNAMIAAAPQLTAGKLSISVERGTSSREGVSGWVTVKWPWNTPADTSRCGRAQVAVDGGWVELNYQNFSCGCDGSRLRPATARHELGHALGYWHTDNPADLMSNFGVSTLCEQNPSARELQAIAYHYR